MKTSLIVALALFCSLVFLTAANAQPLTGPQIDKLAERAIRTFGVPGIAIAVVQDGKVVHAKGYGVRSLDTRKSVDENTMFGIASDSKAFTAAALAILVDEGKLKWDDKVIAYIPEFKMYDPYVTAEFTVRDLLSHHSGLRQNAGDLLHEPDGSDFTVSDIIYALQFFKPVSSFRSKFAYENNLYIVAGEIVARISGMSWEQFIQTRVFTPLGMVQSSASYEGAEGNVNIIVPHSSVDGIVKVIPAYKSTITDAAGGIYSSVSDAAKWMLLQLNDGRYGEGLDKHLFSETSHREMWSPQTIVPVGKGGAYDTHFGAYGFGWFLIDVKGYKEVFHTGEDLGMESVITLIPELHLGIAVLVNRDVSTPIRSITNQIVDSYLGIHDIDRIKESEDSANASQPQKDATTATIWKEATSLEKGDNLELGASVYDGTYHDSWFGDVEVYNGPGGLWLRSKRSPQLAGKLVPYKRNTFLIKWAAPDAYVIFDFDDQGQAKGFKVRPLSKAPSDFQDMDLRKMP